MIVVVIVVAILLLVGGAGCLQFRWTRGPFLLRRWGLKGTAEAVDVEHLRGAQLSGTGEYNLTTTRQRTRLKLRVTLPEAEKPYEATVTTFMPVMAPTDRLTVYVSKRCYDKVYIAWGESPKADVAGGEYGMKGPGAG